MGSPSSNILRLGTRGSRLARMQSQSIADALMQRHPGLQVPLVIIGTTGDRVTDRALHDIGGKGLFTRELELALLHGDIDFAVHSFKDVPVTMPLVQGDDLVIAAIPPRADPRDLLACRSAKTLAALPQRAVVATGSLRRRAQLLQRRPDLQVQPIRGNVDTRLAKLDRGDFEAVILAAAGVMRCGLFDPAYMTPIETDVMLPAAAQGALALQCRRDNAQAIAWLVSLNDPATASCVKSERAVILGLNGDCHSPIAAFARLDGAALHLRAVVADADGQTVLSAQATSPWADPESVARDVVADLLRQGAGKVLHPAENRP